MREAVQLARSGSPDAVDAFDRAAAIIGTALATMANLVGPSVIVVMGESMTDYDLYEQRIRESFDLHTFGSARQCRIITRSHTFEDWARGAAASVIRAAVNEAVASRGLGTRSAKHSMGDGTERVLRWSLGPGPVRPPHLGAENHVLPWRRPAFRLVAGKPLNGLPGRAKMPSGRLLYEWRKSKRCFIPNERRVTLARDR